MEEKKLFERLVVPLVILGLFIYGVTGTPKNKTSAQSPVKFHFLNVGQGDAALIENEGALIMVDGGPDQSVLQRVGEQTAKKTIEGAFLSHPHADHLAGFNYLFDRYEIKNFFLTESSHNTPDYLELLQKINDSGKTASPLYAGKIYHFQDLSIKTIWPNRGARFKDQNDSSAVFVASFGQVKVLFLGDLSEKKQQLLAESMDLPDVDIIKIAHHGSRTGLSLAFLEEVSPEYAVISVGENRYGQPSELTLKKLRGRRVLRTDQVGTISFGTDGQKIDYLKN